MKYLFIIFLFFFNWLMLLFNQIQPLPKYSSVPLAEARGTSMLANQRGHPASSIPKIDFIEQFEEFLMILRGFFVNEFSKTQCISGMYLICHKIQ